MLLESVIGPLLLFSSTIDNIYQVLRISLCSIMISPSTEGALALHETLIEPFIEGNS